MADFTKEVNSFVFLDLEATGLAETGDKPRITEVGLVSVNRTSLKESSMPRVLNKLTICVDPEKPISSQACTITGLYNDALSFHPPFNDYTADLIETFLRLLPQPVCVLAHNGFKFDFPLLVAELNRIGRRLPEGLLCADTLDGLREILSTDAVKLFLAKSLPARKEEKMPSPQPGPSAASSVGKGKASASRRILGPTDITPEMQTVKVTNFSNAPRKKPVNEEQPKEERVTTVKRKLNFGSSTPAPDKNDIDDVDVEDAIATLSGGFRVTLNSTQEFQRLSPEPASADVDSQATLPFAPSPTRECSQNESDPFLLDDIPDDLLVNAVEQLENKADQSSPAMEPKPSTSKGCASSKTWAQIMQDSIQSPSTAKKVTDENKNLTESSEGVQGPPVTSPATPNTSSQPNNAVNTTPETGSRRFLDSFPTPSPSPHKVLDEEEDAWPMLISPSASACPSPNPIGAGRKKSSRGVGFSLALHSVHSHVVGHGPANSHTAEDDCMSLLRIAHKLSPWFCDWVDQNASDFDSVTPLYCSSKRPKKS